MEEPVLKTSKCLSCDIVKGSQPFKSGDELPGEPLRGRLYEALFATGDKAYIKGTDDRPPLYVGPQGKEWFYAFRLVPKKRADNSYILTIEVDRNFEPGEKMPLKKSKLADGSAAAAIAAQVPGVTTADKVAPPAERTTISIQEALGVEAIPSNSIAPGPASVPPSMRPPTKSFEDTAKDTVKLTPEQLRAEAAKPVAPAIPDNVPRKGVVKLMNHTVEVFDKGKTTKLKWVITLEDGFKGIMWSDTPEQLPVTVGQEITYTLGKMYGDGQKIELTASNSPVDRETILTRIACVNSAIAFDTASAPTTRGLAWESISDVFAIAKMIEAHVLRPIE